MANLTAPLLYFLQQIEFVNEAADSIFDYVPIVDQTNEYEAKYFLKFEKNASPSLTVLYDEIKGLLTLSNHYVSDKIVTGTLVLFSISGKASRSGETILKFFSLINPLKLKQYLLFEGKPVERIAELKFFDYTIGELDYEKFKKFLSNHSGSD